MPILENMPRPLPITILSFLAVLIGAGAWLVAGLAWAGSEAVWKPQGFGPNRIALAEPIRPVPRLHAMASCRSWENLLDEYRVVPKEKRTWKDSSR
jgi:hypothetical protein